MTLAIKLLRFKSTFSPNKVNIDDYLKTMKQGQDKIYFLISTDNDTSSNIYLEPYKGTEIPILFSTVQFDEIIFKQVGSYKSKK